MYFALCEGLTNAVKHARADNIELCVRAAQGQVIAEVRDDGNGQARPLSGKGGLSGMNDRVDALHGSIELDSGPAHGTIIRISLPAR